MAEFPAMPVTVNDFLGDTTHLDATEVGAYWLLLCAMWQAGGELPYDHKRLARMARLGARKWDASWPTLAEFFVVDEDKIFHPKMQEILQKVRIKSQKASQSARAKWRKNKGLGHANAERTQSERNAIKVKEDTNVSSPPLVPPKGETKKQKRKTRIDPDQEINQKQTEYAESKGLWKLALADEWDRFKNYHIMHDNKFVDWNRAWYNWVTSPYRKASHGNQSGSEGNGTIAFLEKAKARGLGQRKAERGDSGDSAFEDLYPDQGFRTIEGER